LLAEIVEPPAATRIPIMRSLSRRSGGIIRHRSLLAAERKASTGLRAGLDLGANKISASQKACHGTSRDVPYEFLITNF
jgi:hypothetical protein